MRSTLGKNARPRKYIFLRSIFLIIVDARRAGGHAWKVLGRLERSMSSWVHSNTSSMTCRAPTKSRSSGRFDIVISLYIKETTRGSKISRKSRQKEDDKSKPNGADRRL